MKSNKTIFWVTMLILIAVVSRFFMFIPNFQPIIGISLLGAAYLQRKYWVFLVPIAAFWLSDVVLNNTVYAAYFPEFSLISYNFIFAALAMILVVLIGKVMLKNKRWSNIWASAIVGGLLFFVVSNLGVWLFSGMYPPNGAGLVACYVAGIPFLQNALLGDLFYTTFLFGAMQLVSSQQFSWSK
ncbi:MAG: DUF6580 family putative transport protein [Chitinophagales bacterium]|nr:hypothetical protein [Bacteroidota bacterium]MCB9042148.1 hypothetical protein [Chitinophagales bacterium]